MIRSWLESARVIAMGGVLLLGTGNAAVAGHRPAIHVIVSTPHVYTHFATAPRYYAPYPGYYAYPPPPVYVPGYWAYPQPRPYRWNHHHHDEYYDDRPHRHERGKHKGRHRHKHDH